MGKIQNEINSTITTAAALKLGKDIYDKLPSQAEVEAKMGDIKDAPISEAAKKAAGDDAKFAYEGTKEANDLKKANEKEMENINNTLTRLDKGFEYSETNFDWDQINNDVSDIQANIDKIMKERAESVLPGKIEAAHSRGNFEQIREAAKNGGKVRPYVIIKGSSTRKKYLD